MAEELATQQEPAYDVSKLEGRRESRYFAAELVGRRCRADFKASRTQAGTKARCRNGPYR